MFAVRRATAKANGIPFTIKIEDLPRLPMYCPVLGLKLQFNDGKAREDSYSLDRIIPSKGYVKGNLQWLSQRANTLKSDLLPEQFQARLNKLERNN